ncbi:hypothetical protein AALO_G00196230 [Alosa alosa]|uniref:Peptidase C76 domain-containing protein n=1 Tax=Alosa alosa TaxID=278164 RepID=A0AAV6G726_9TELE|nr:hypothetical protein AALO_G00196230 [Alosa alosa]
MSWVPVTRLGVLVKKKANQYQKTFQYHPIPSKTCQNLPTSVPEYPTNQPTVTSSVNEIASNCVCITEPCVPERSVLIGSFHQGHARFGNARNRQCGAISLTALLMCKMKSVLTWEPEDLDEVLVQGTVLYRSMRAQGKIRDHVDGRGYIAVSELPRRHRLWNCVFTIDFAESFTGIVHVDDYDHALRDVAMPFDVAIQRTLLSNDGCLLTICANTCAIVKEGSKFAFIDSHANGRVNQKGQDASCVAYFSCVESLFTFVYNFARSFGVDTPRFELTGVNARIIDGSIQMSNASSCTMSSANCLAGYSDVVKDAILSLAFALPVFSFASDDETNCSGLECRR